ncbi:MAG: hypothetical protein MJY85_07305 [Fibrobacter sp.]|nr:hypothetical protein [Fibrobacter sp.]
MRQFDVFVLDDTPDFDSWTPLFEDPSLGWFHVKDWNSDLEKLEAEWIVFTHRSIKIDRDFLNNLAQVIEGYPMVDAFAPRLNLNGKFMGGLVLDNAAGFKSIDENEKMRFVAAPIPVIGVFSRRIIQRTGLFDKDLPAALQLADYTLRMYHAGGKMFSVPYLVAEPATEIGFNYTLKNLIGPMWDIIYKCLPPTNLIAFTLRHPSTIAKWFKSKKTLKFKAEKATALSKLSDKTIKEISLKNK